MPCYTLLCKGRRKREGDDMPCYAVVQEKEKEGRG